MNGYEEHARSTRNFFQMLEERSGRTATTAFCTVSLWYFLAHTAVFARLCAELLRAYLARGARAAALCVLPILAGLMYLKRKGSGARAGRYLEAALFILSAGCVWFMGDRVPIGLLHDGTTYALRLGPLFPAIGAGGREIAAALLLLIGLFIAVAGGLRYVRAAGDYLYKAGEEFFRRWRTRRRGAEPVETLREESGIHGISCARVCRWIAVLAVYTLSVGFVDAFAAVTFYRSYNLQILVPVMLLLYLLLLIPFRQGRSISSEPAGK